jgi:two-component system cell cycle sensor histidine kinase/response regulator CckA
MKLEHQFEQLQLLYELAQAVNRADEPGEIYRAAVEGLVRVVAADRASVMTFDADGVMRYKAWKGISDRHRATMERPISINWRRGARNVRAVTVADVTQDPSLSPLLPAFANEGIRALALIPLLGNGGLIGKFVLYYDAPHEFLTEELQLAQTIATHVAFAAERHLAEAALRESEERFRRVFEEGPLGLGLVGKDYHFIKVNSALCQMVEYSEAELLQKSFVDITHPDDLQADVELAQQLFRSEKPFYKLQKRYVKKNGEIIWINLTGSLIRDKEGEPLYGLAMIEDITEVKRAQEEALARQKLESVGVLAGGIAHDFNNLLGGIMASAELALTECAEGSAVEEELQRIKTTSIRGAEIVRELMIYGGEESPILELVDISAMVNEMLQLLKVSISKHTILKIELGQDLPPAYANPAQIRQVVMNLVTNASEAIGEQSGEIRVTSGKVKLGPESLALGGVDLAAGDYLRLEVFDTGGGMTPEVQARIFDPFFTTKRAGRGLGLAAVQGIIRSHGGTISIKSAPGQGSRFEILLPCVDQVMQEVRDITVTPSAKEPGTIFRTVLVVEDEETLRLAVSKMLRKAGFSVIEAGDGTTAANLFRANKRKIDVVLLDMTLPGMSGREVLEELRTIQPGVKVILTTAFSQASALSSIGEQHLWGFVRKPYKLSELTSLLRIACLDKPKMSGNAPG